MDISYSALLTVALGNDRHAIKDLSAMTEAHGHPISVRNIQRYKAGTMIPSLDNAVWLLKLLNFDISQEDVMESLRIGKDQKKPLTRNSPSSITVSIVTRNLTTDIVDEETAEILLRQRAKEVTGESGDLSKYIEYLIKNDLNLDNLMPR